MQNVCVYLCIMYVYEQNNYLRNYQFLFDFDPPSMVFSKRYDKFIARYDSCCMLLAHYY